MVCGGGGGLSFFLLPASCGSPTLGTSALFAQFKASSMELKCSVGAHSQLVWNRQRRDICPIYCCIYCRSDSHYFEVTESRNDFVRLSFDEIFEADHY